jgi:hypothetical protein
MFSVNPYVIIYCNPSPVDGPRRRLRPRAVFCVNLCQNAFRRKGDCGFSQPSTHLAAALRVSEIRARLWAVDGPRRADWDPPQRLSGSRRRGSGRWENPKNANRREGCSRRFASTGVERRLASDHEARLLHPSARRRGRGSARAQTEGEGECPSVPQCPPPNWFGSRILALRSSATKMTAEGPSGSCVRFPADVADSEDVDS